jgi:hypothetical protein
MLGPLRIPDSWKWGAVGKHPVARDYISIGFISPCLRMFSGLVEKAFMKTASIERRYVAYRYFLKGRGKGIISCGILKDSRDAVGREYPLLVDGHGTIGGWEERWESIPAAMAAVCSEAEYMSSRKFTNLDEFKTGLSGLGVPSLVSGPSFAGMQEFGSPIPGSGLIPLVPGDEDAMTEQISGYMSLLRKSDPATPEAVFIGGTNEKSCLAVFRKPLDVNNVLDLLTYV